jgi:hypothetical protein
MIVLRRFVLVIVFGFAVCCAFPTASVRAADAGTDPLTSPIVTDDIARFWHAIDDSTPATRADVLQREYLDPGSIGVRDFIPNRIKSAANLAEKYEAHSVYYGAIRDASLRIAAQTPAIRAAFVRMQSLVDGAVFPPISFVIGALNSGGTNSSRGIIVGVELVVLPPKHDPAICVGMERICAAESGPEETPAVAAHELTHFEQDTLRAGRPYGTTILAEALVEGVADFMGSCAAKLPLASLYRSYGDAHYAEVREAFRRESGSPSDGSDWFYNDPTKHPGWPNDMGYYVGYEMAKAYVARAPDQHAAIRELLIAADPAQIGARSGYYDSMAPQPMPTICTGS